MNALNCSAVLEGLGRLSVQAGVLVLLVLLTQWLFRRQLTPRWRCSLWLLVVARLCLPVSFGSVVSIFNLLPRLSAKTESHSQPSSQPASYPPAEPASPPSLAETRVVDNPVPQSPSLPRAQEAESSTLVPPVIPSPILASESHPSTETQAIKPAKIVWPFILFAAWLAGLLSLAGYVTVTSLRLADRLAKANRVTDPAVIELLDACRQQMRVRTRLNLAESSYVRSPVLYGLRRPRLLLPSDFTQQFPQHELRFVFLHELAHLRRRDLLMNWIVTVLQLVYWFNPLVWFGFTRWRADRELACDALVLETAGSEQNKAYGRTILHLLETITMPVTIPGLVGILEDKRQLRQRMSLIARFQPCRRWGFASLLLLVVLGLVCLTDAQTSKLKDEKASGREKATAESTIKTNLVREVRHGADPLPTNNDTNTIIHSLTVIVKDAATAKPVPNAEVYIVDENPVESQPRRLTDENGQYILRISPPPKENRASVARISLAAQHPQYAMHSIILSSWAGVVYDVLPKEVTITMEPGITIGGQVQDERGVPLAGIRVLLTASHEPGGFGRRGVLSVSEYPFLRLTDKANPAAVTDKNGLWTFAHMPTNIWNLHITLMRPDESCESFEAIDYLPSFWPQQWSYIAFDHLLNQTAMFTIEEGITVRGLVVDEKGRPLSGVLIKEGYGPNEAIRVSEFKTGANGRFEVRHRMPRQWIYTASAIGRATVSTVVQVKPGMPEVRLVMPPAKPLLIEVTDEEHKPIKGMGIRPHLTQNEGQILDWEGQTDAQGLVVWTNAPNVPVMLLATTNSQGVGRKFKAIANGSVTRLVLTRNGVQFTTFQIKAVDAQSHRPVIINQVSAIEFTTLSQSTLSVLAQPGTNEFQFTLQRKPALESYSGAPHPLLLVFEAKGFEPCVLNCPKSEEGDQDLSISLVPGMLTKCTVLTPDNRPAGGAKILARPYERGITSISYSPGQHFNGISWLEFLADEDGKFNVPLVPDEQPVVITHDQGILQTTVTELKRKPIVKLQAFGRIDGQLIVNGQSKEGVSIILSDNCFIKSDSIYRNYITSSITNGLFSFSKVPPGEYLLSRRYTPHSGRFGTSHQMPIIIKPGETLKIEYRERGRQILGRAVTSPAGTATDWLNDQHQLVLKQKTVPPLMEEDYASSKAYAEARAKLVNSPAYSKKISNRRNYELIFNADGTFHADDVPPGTYELLIRVSRSNWPSDGNVQFLGSLVREVVVPPGDQPFNLGDVVVKMRNKSLGITAAEVATERQNDLPAMVGNYVISPTVRDAVNRLPTETRRIEYLSSIIVSNATPQPSATENYEKASAIRLLGAIRNTNSIRILISNIAFKDLKSKVQSGFMLARKGIPNDYPAVVALAAIGEPAVPQLLDLVENGNDSGDPNVSCAVQTLLLIKGDKYSDFVNEQRARMPVNTWFRLSGVIQD